MLGLHCDLKCYCLQTTFSLSVTLLRSTGALFWHFYERQKHHRLCGANMQSASNSIGITAAVLDTGYGYWSMTKQTGDEKD